MVRLIGVASSTLLGNTISPKTSCSSGSYSLPAALGLSVMIPETWVHELCYQVGPESIILHFHWQSFPVMVFVTEVSFLDEGGDYTSLWAQG